MRRARFSAGKCRHNSAAKTFRPCLERLEDRTAPAVVTWASASSGFWDVPSNWSGGAVPGPDDDVVINQPGSITVTHRTDSTTVHSLACADNLVVTASSALLETDGLRLGNNASLSVSAASTFAADGPGTIDGANLSASGGSTLSLPGVTAVDYGGLPERFIEANGIGTFIDLSHVMQWHGSGYNPRLGVTATGGALIDVSGVTEAQGNTMFTAQGPTSRIELTALTSIASTDSRSSGLEALQGGTVDAPALTDLNWATLVVDGNLATHQIVTLTNGGVTVQGRPADFGCLTNLNNSTVTLDGGGPADFHNVSVINRANLLVSGGVTLALPAVTSVDYSDVSTRTIQASGAGSRIDLSRVTHWRGLGASGAAMGVAALDGGVVDISGLARMELNTSLVAQGSDSLIDLSSLTAYTANSPLVSAIRASDGGRIAFSAEGVVVVNVNLSMTREGTISTGALRLNNGATLFGAATIVGDLVVNGAQVQLNAASDLLTVTGAFTLSAGSVNGPGALTVNCLFQWTGGSMSGTGRTTAQGGLVIDGATSKPLGSRTLVNAGAATWTGAGEIAVDNGGGIENALGAVFDVQTDAALRLTAGTAQLVNAGTFRKTVTTGRASNFGVTFTNTGSAAVEVGTLGFSAPVTNAGTLTVGADATLVAAGGYTQTGGTTVLGGGTLSGNVTLSGGVLSGSGTVDGSLQNNARVTVGGTDATGLLVVTGNYTQSASAILDIKLADTQDYDVLQVHGTSTLDGTLNVRVIGGFTPAEGDAFLVLDAQGGLTGTFATINGTHVGSGLELVPSYSDFGLTLVTVAAQLGHRERC